MLSTSYYPEAGHTALGLSPGTGRRLGHPTRQVMTAGATADPIKDYLRQIGKVAGSTISFGQLL